MKFKCIEQDGNCVYAKKYGDNWYCEIGHKPNHVWKADGNIVYPTNQCAEDKRYKKEVERA